MSTDLEQRLRAALHEDAQRARLVNPDGPPAPEVVALGSVVGRRRSMRTLVAVAAVMALLALAAAVALFDSDQDVDTTPVTEPTTTTAPPIWSGPELDRGNVVHPMAVLPWDEPGVREFSWQDPLDAAMASVDVTGVRSLEPHPGGMNGYWSLELAAMPPLPTDLDPGMVVTFGVAFDMNADGIADYMAGIDGDAAIRDGFRAWVTDLATDETREQVGGPYGFPIEFNYTTDEGCIVSDEEPNCAVDLMFLGSDPSMPTGLNPQTARFYVWTAVTRDGVLVANDYAPDTGWLSSE